MNDELPRQFPTFSQSEPKGTRINDPSRRVHVSLNDAGRTGESSTAAVTHLYAFSLLTAKQIGSRWQVNLAATSSN